MLLSIAIPTMKREKLLKLNSNFYKELALLDNIELIFLVNYYESDASYEYLKNEFKNYNNIKVYKQEQFVPFGVNFIDVIKKAKGKYIFTLSDEDIININNLNKVINYLNKNYIIFATSPLVIKRNNEYIKYRSLFTLKTIKYIKSLKYYNLSLYISGLIFFKNDIMNLINLIDNNLIKSNYFLKLYPQTFFFLVLFVKNNNCKNIYFNFEIVKKIFYEKSLVEKEYENDYGTLEERYKQLSDLTNILDYLIKKKYLNISQRNEIIFYVNKSILNLITPNNYSLKLLKKIERIFL